MDKSDAMIDTVFAPLADEARARDVAEIVARSQNLPPHLARVAHAYAARWFYLQMRFTGREGPGMTVEALWRSLERVLGMYGAEAHAGTLAQ
ncbi:hypothetical protein [Burkholderia gladioli]|uniref:hypothetical protein n=1 Tax=Burkholderia gladioli TaxID=28095 RepID=UPI000BEF229D|nr:hypothetical protein [Burkholderia gladioli]MBU9172898.1 hypothetical protein [Burkholderia gladioli]MBU9385650.1 hypothetical protein [Burkholderia gladioli]MDN7728314.1 hypothetical protein [Burkholderia gladioli]MDN7807297.1 hypothetical protein [Burkholderia gladioli]PEH80376.1 hypothetical protein CRM95_36100 [Burkholderia gladioli]